MKAIRVDLFELNPMDIVEAIEKGYINNGPTNKIDGYEITCPDGYKTWCPKDIADKAFLSLMRIMMALKFVKKMLKRL